MRTTLVLIALIAALVIPMYACLVAAGRYDEQNERQEEEND